MASGQQQSRRLSADEKARLVDILEQGSRAAGYNDDRWTLERVADVIASNFAVFYTGSGARSVLRALGYTYEGKGRRGRWVRMRV